MRARDIERKTALRTAGLCTSCGKNPLATKNQCRSCADKNNKRILSSHRERIAGGFCKSCGTAPLETKTMCRICADKMRLRNTAKAHGIPLDDYLLLLETGCHICGGTAHLSVDHDHACCDERFLSCKKCNRGLLCNAHNLAVAFIESFDALVAVRYLQATRSSSPLIQYITELENQLTDLGLPGSLNKMAFAKIQEGS